MESLFDDNALADKLREALQAASADLYIPYVPTNNRGHGCSVSGCPNVAFAKGLCNAHYIRARKGKPLTTTIQHRGRRLICAECGAPVDGKGGWALCKQHYRLKRRRIIRRVCAEYLGNRCARCGEQYPDYVYDFHHRNAQEKDHHPANMIDSASLAEIAREVAKCDLLCANCHRIEHHGSEQFQAIVGSSP